MITLFFLCISVYDFMVEARFISHHMIIREMFFISWIDSRIEIPIRIQDTVQEDYPGYHRNQKT